MSEWSRFVLFPTLPRATVLNKGWDLLLFSHDDEYAVEQRLQVIRWNATAGIPVDGEKIGEPLKYQHSAVVYPVRPYRFPFDMLRYDRCQLFDAADVSAVARSHAEPQPEIDPIRVVKYSESAKNPWTHARWSSFGWRLESVSSHEH